jgi:hypothetical protein
MCRIWAFRPRKIGETVGQAFVDEVKKRGWDMKNVGAIRVSYDQLPTAVDRVEGAISTLKAAGLPAANIYRRPAGEDGHRSCPQRRDDGSQQACRYQALGRFRP